MCQAHAETAPETATATYVTLAEATRIASRPANQIRTLAASGRIRVDAPPGCRTKYHRGDVEAARLGQLGLPVVG
jgi:hypothetical protein